MNTTLIKEQTYIHDDEYYYTILRKNIRKYRLEQNLTQQNLADLSGLSRDYICDIENESRQKHPTVAVIGRIAEALNKNIGELFIDNN